MNLSFFNKKPIAREAQKSAPVAMGGTISRRLVVAKTPPLALKVSAVYAAVRILSDSAAQLPLEFLRYNAASGTFVPCDRGTYTSLYYALTVRPNSRLTAFQFKKQIVTDLHLRGNAYIIPIKDSADNVRSFELVRPESVTYDQYTNRYSIADPVTGVSGNLYADDVIHVKNTSLDGGYTGVSTIRYAATQLNIAATASSETLDRYATGGSGKYIYHDDNSVVGYGAVQDDELLKAGNDIQSQLREGNDVVIVRGSGKLESMSMSAQDLQFLESARFNVREIARFFGVPPTKLYEEMGSGYKTADAANVALYSETLRPLFANIEAEFTAKLVNPSAYGRYKFAFNTDALYISDLITEADYMTKRINSGTMTVNEARRKKGLEPVEGGDVAMISTNMAALTSNKITEQSNQNEG